MKNLSLWAIIVCICFYGSAAFAQVPPLLGKGGANASKPIEITADKLVVVQEKEIAIFNGNVKAVQGTLNLTSDKMTVHYKNSREEKRKSTKENSVSKIEVDGNVFLATPEETAQGQSGVYNVDTAMVTLLGSVVLTKNQNIIRGNKLIYNLKTGKSELYSNGSAVEKGAKTDEGRVKGLFVPEN